MNTLEAQIREELRQILVVLQEVIGLSSRWSGRVELVPDAEFRGRKPFSCDILIDAELARQPQRWATLIHEALHSVSAGNNLGDYQTLRGWEEGTVEQLQRLLRPEILKRLGVSVAEETFQEHESHHIFNVYIQALEEIRMALHDENVPQDAITFYRNLLATPLRERPGYALGLGYQRAGLPRTPFVRAFSSANAVLTRKPL